VSLQARIGVRLGNLNLRADLSVGDGEMIAIIGPNGAGKTTLLRSLAGLMALGEGRIVVDEVVLDDPQQRIWVPPERRPVGMVFQDYLLFPHLSAIDNVAFGLRSRGTRKPAARAAALKWLNRVGLADHATQRSRALSGGQAQRVALARALVTEPRLLLLDEPLAAVDVSARAELRRTLRLALADHSGVRLLVTHDPREAAVLADRIVVLEAGAITQAGTVAEVTTWPRSSWMAQMIGLNLFHGHAQGTRIHLTGPHPPDTDLITATDTHGAVFTVIHPRAVTLHRTRPNTSTANVFPGISRSIDIDLDRIRVQITGPLPLTAEITPVDAAELHLIEAAPVWLSIKPTELAVYQA